ncbi:MAG: DUF1998 domain-containing protein, partial [Planctomycetales bacterium]|nr:DUF1998 domain-containing protein [Planctomycetales bacterium]
LTGEPDVTVVSEDGSPHAGRVVLFLNPPFGAAPSTLAARVVRAACGLGLRTIAFTQARRMTELLFTWISDAARDLAPRLSAYRAGYRPEERREIEAKLSSGELLGVISTSALEAGIDIGGLDVCVLVGYPGTVTATWQRAGRVGRAGRESLLVLVAGRDALDQYVVRHPAEVFARGAEAAVCDPANPEVLKAHLPCAAAEIPLAAGEPLLEAARARGALDALRKSGALLESAEGGRFLAARKLPHRDVDIREVGGSYTILREGSDEPIGTLSSGRAFAEAHPGAIYLHRGDTWRVTRLDIPSRLAYAAPADVPYYTEALGERDTEILETTRVRPLGNTVLRLGRLRVTTRVTGFQRRHVGTREVLGAEPLDLPPQAMETEGIWVEVPDRVVEHLSAIEGHVMGAIHAAEHASIAVVPLFVLCDRGDVAGISFTTHPQVGRAVFFLYDGTAGGVGLSTRIFDVAEAVLGRARDAIRDCPCEEGCPACVQSPRCGNGNVPLDKRASVEALRALLGDIPLADLARGEGPPAPAPGPAEPAAPAPPAGRPPRVVVFDVETQRSAEEVGGWGNAHLMRVAVVCAWVLPEGEMREYREGEVGDLLRLFDGADLVVGFNCVRFDYSVLSAYTPKDLRKLPTLDILVEVEKALGHRLPLAHLARTTLGTEKSADGLQSLRWWREGAVEKILAYCRKDVEITRDLYLHGLEKGFLLYDVRPDERVRVPVDFKRAPPRG